MGFLSRKPQFPDTAYAADLRRTVPARGSADVAGARKWLNDYIDMVFYQARVKDSPQARAWVSDRIRVLIYLALPWFETLDERIPELTPSLKAEYVLLLRSPGQYPTEHIVAWWWNLQPGFFVDQLKVWIGNQADKLAEATQSIQATGGDFASSMFDWSDVGEHKP